MKNKVKSHTKTGSIIFLIIICLSSDILITSFSLPNHNYFQEEKGIIMDIPGYPLVFELNRGDSILIDHTYKNKRTIITIFLKDIRSFTEHNNWFPDSTGKRNFYKAEADIIVSGKKCTLILQPYQMPVAANGLRIYIEAIKELDERKNLDPIHEMKKDVRFSVCLEDEPWGIPAEIVFPVNDYRWRSASYNNTWSALVPFNALYYHRGEDFGAIPDKIVVCSCADGIVTESPLNATGIGSNSNAIQIRNKNGIVYGYYHCNIESIDTCLHTGLSIKKGQPFAKTGMTWDYRKSQHMDPHLHAGIEYYGFQISFFPYLIEAYFRKYDDKLLAVAGGYRFANAGDSIILDATRSICRENEKIKSYQWKLHDGKIVNQPVIKVKDESPGFYSEELTVKTEKGDIDKDFLQVRVNDPNSSGEIAYGWAYYYPLRNIKPGQNILFWNRIINTKTDVSINFGDGTPVRLIRDEIYHSFSRSGNYTVELFSKGKNNEPVSVKLEVIVN